MEPDVQAAAREGLAMERAMDTAWAGGQSGAAVVAADGALHTVSAICFARCSTDDCLTCVCRQGQLA